VSIRFRACLLQPVLYYFGYLHTNVWIAGGTAFVMGVTTFVAGAPLGHEGQLLSLS
jgi:hypothetical protein